MNRKYDRDAKLLAELFHDDWTEGPAAGYARKAAAAARRRRQLPRALLGGAAATAAGAAAFWLAMPSSRQPLPAAAPAIAPPIARAFEIISDDELLVELRDRPVLVVTKADGTREITLLDPAPASDPLE